MATYVKGKNPRKPHTIRYQDNGRQRERSFATKREADDFKIKFEHDNREHTFVDPRAGKATFKDAAEAYIDNLDRAANTKTGYRVSLRTSCKSIHGRTLASLAQDRDGVVALINGLKEDKSASTANVARSLIVGVMNAAKASGKISSHRLDKITVRRNKVKAAVIIPCTMPQLETLAKAMPASVALVVWLMRGCGLRVSEAMAVRLDGFRSFGKILRVHEQVTREGGYGPLKDRQQGEYRDIPVPAWLWAKVQAHVAEHGTHDGYLFPMMSYHGVAGPFKRGVKAAKLGDDFTPHQLRHQFASVLLGKWVPLTVVADWLGHKDINVTHQVYSHLLPDSWEQGREALELLAA
jgi:integrase